MKWTLSIPENSIMVYYCAKLTGLAQFTLIKDNFYPPTLLAKLYTVLIATINLFLGTEAVFQSTSKLDIYGFSQFAKIGAFIHHLTSFSITSMILITFFSMHKEILYIMKKLQTIGKELKNLGIEEDHEKFFKNLFVTTIVTNAIIVSTTVTLCSFEPNWPILNSIKYIIDSWLYLNVVLIFTNILFLIRQRFKLINEKLYNVFRPAAFGRRRSLNNLRMFLVCEYFRGDHQPRIEDLNGSQRIQKIETFHLELCDLVYRTTSLFAIPFSVKTIDLSTDLILHCFWIYFVIRNSGQPDSIAQIDSLVINLVCTLIKMIIAIVHLFAIANASVKVCKEGNATRAVLSKVWYMFELRKLKDEFVMFFLQLMQKPVIVSIFNYCNLDYSYVYKLLGVVVAYTVIIIQSDAQ